MQAKGFLKDPVLNRWGITQLEQQSAKNNDGLPTGHCHLKQLDN
jgi:hypothetical protein